MSVGLFIGIRASYVQEAQDRADTFIRAINIEMRKRRLPDYVEPAELPDVYSDYMFGRSALDHGGASSLSSLAEAIVSRSAAPHAELLTSNVYRVAFLPLELPRPMETMYRERFFDEKYAIWVGSAPGLLREVVAYGPHLGIPVEAEGLSDSVARKINDHEALFAGDPLGPAADRRRTWLLLHEGARLAVATGVALSLAG